MDFMLNLMVTTSLGHWQKIDWNSRGMLKNTWLEHSAKRLIDDSWFYYKYWWKGASLKWRTGGKFAKVFETHDCPKKDFFLGSGFHKTHCKWLQYVWFMFDTMSKPLGKTGLQTKPEAECKMRTNVTQKFIIIFTNVSKASHHSFSLSCFCFWHKTNTVKGRYMSMSLNYCCFFTIYTYI